MNMKMDIQKLPSHVSTVKSLYQLSQSKYVWEESGERTAANELCVGLSVYVSLFTVFPRTGTYIRQLRVVCSFSAALQGRDKAPGSVCGDLQHPDRDGDSG